MVGHFSHKVLHKLYGEYFKFLKESLVFLGPYTNNFVNVETETSLYQAKDGETGNLILVQSEGNLHINLIV